VYLEKENKRLVVQMRQKAQEVEDLKRMNEKMQSQMQDNLSQFGSLSQL